MPNTNAPFGFRQRSGNGSAPTYEQVIGQCVYNASAMFYGDPIEPNASGYLVVGTGSTTIAGIFQGCKYLSVTQKRTIWNNYWPGSDVASGQFPEIYYISDPNARFVAQSDATGIALADVNNNIGYTIGTGNTQTGISGAALSAATLNTTATLPFRVLGLITDPPSGIGTQPGAYNWVLVGFNSVATKQLTGI
jgi:hypothetical protein